MNAADTIIREHFDIHGQVQGVGFRPFVYRLAGAAGVTGFVINDSRGVTIEIQGTTKQVAEFGRRLPAELPPLARVQSVESRSVPAVLGEDRFEIRASEGGGAADAQVTVDTATCDDCLREMRDKADPRHQYPFINCTNCGPRYSIIRAIPYDRPKTTMAEFGMCALCGGEYRDPANRRFHAQPVACARCGPAIWLVDPKGRQITRDDAIARTVELLRGGGIVALKGLGGFHLVCRADEDEAVLRLRRRKRRDAKPFALMAPDLGAVRRLCEVSDAAAALLQGPLRPIVVMPARPGAVSRYVGEGLDTLGVMLPYTPLHHLLFDHGLPALVMTSANYSDEPLVKDNDQALSQLGAIADALLLHNRRIERRLDDSVVQVDHAGDVNVLRRARGYAPEPVHLAAFDGAPAVLAVGAELKSTFCLAARGRAILSEHIGDLKDGRVYRHFLESVHGLEKLFEIEPRVIAADLHPQYLSTAYALQRVGEIDDRRLPVVRVQHHHAHVAACLAENGREGPAIGLACDGVGQGDDDAAWGGEVLVADLLDYRRLGHIRYVPLIGGDAAARDGWRAALAVLHDAFGLEAVDRLSVSGFEVESDRLRTALEMLAVGLNCPPTSSLGRWFDAAAYLAGIVPGNRYEGEAPMRLEAAADPEEQGEYEFHLSDDDPFNIDLRPLTAGLVADRAAGVPAAALAARFHNTIAAAFAAAAEKARAATGLKLVALSGGCFANRRLTAALSERLSAAGFEVLRHRVIPCNDGGVALGQAAVAAARSRTSATSFRRRAGVLAGDGARIREEEEKSYVLGYSRAD